MIQSQNLSTEVLNLVNNYLAKNNDAATAARSLMATLYTNKFGYPYPHTALCRREVKHEYSFIDQYVFVMKDVFSDEESYLLKEEYEDVIRYCWEIIKKYEKKKIRPENNRFYFCEGFEKIFQFIAPFCCDEYEKTVCLPYAANGNFILDFEECNIHLLDDILENKWFDKIFASACCAECEFYTTEEYIESYAENDLDYIITCPPFVNGAEKKIIIELFYHLIVKALRKNGDFFAILPMSFCHELSGWHEIREVIFKHKNEFSMDVIALPAIFLPQTSIKVCLLHLKKDYKGNVNFMDATGEIFNDKLYFKDNKVNAALLVEDLRSNRCNVWHGTFDDIQQRKIGDFSEIENALVKDISRYDEVFNVPSDDLSFQPGHYIFDNLIRTTREGEVDLTIGDIVVYKNVSARSYSGNSVVCLDNKILTEDFLRYELNQDHLQPIDSMMRNQELSSRVGDDKIANSVFGYSDGFKLSDYSIVGKGDLIIGYFGGKFKFCKLIGEKDCLFKRNRNTFVVSRIDERVTSDYFVRFLRSKELEKQALMLASGIVTSNITRDNFSRIVISVPSKEKQEDAIKQDQRASLTQADKELLENAEEFRKDMHVKKHAIGQTVGDMGSWVCLLEAALEDGSINPDIEIGRYAKTRLEDVICNISRCMEKLETQLQKFDAGYGMKPELIILADYVEDYIKRNSRPGMFDFVFNKKDYCRETVCDKDGNILEEIDGKAVEGIYFPKEALNSILDNIVANACKHGFENRTNNKIKFEIQFEPESGLNLVVKNNGKEMSDAETKNVFSYGISSKEGKDGHYGIGGYEVKKLMQEFGGNASVCNWDPFENNDDYKVVYVLAFSKNNLDEVYG